MSVNEIERARMNAERLLLVEDINNEKLLFQLGNASLNGYSTDDFHRGFSTDVRDLGLEIFSRWNRSFHLLVCGASKDDSQFRNEILTAISGKTALAPIFAGIGVAAFGMSAPIAAIIGTLMARYLVEPTIDEVCKFWHNKLTNEGEQ